MIVFVLALECVPLQDPNAGWADNYGLWIRCAVICGVIAYTMLVELRNVVEAVAMSIRQVTFVLICAMIGNVTLCMVVAGSLAFPIPFMSVVMVPPLLTIVAVSLRLTLGQQGFKQLVGRSEQLWDFVLFILAQALTLVVYPVYQVLFHAAVSTHYELPVMTLLPVLKLITKNIVACSIRQMEDMLPEAVTFTVDFFNAVYLATCLQQMTSVTTVSLVMAASLMNTALALYDLYLGVVTIRRRLSREASVLVHDIALLDLGHSLCTEQSKFARQDLKQIQLRSCLPQALSQTGKLILHSLDKFPLKPSVKLHSRRLRPASESEASMLNAISTATPKKTPNFARSSSISRHSKIYTQPPQQPMQSKVSLRVQHPSRVLQITLEVLFRSEFLVLNEYLESFIPLFYASFVRVMVHLPSGQYHKELQGITQENALQRLQPVLLNGLLECASFLLVVRTIRRITGAEPLSHLAFVLETQRALVQSKLVVWMLLTLTCRVVHYGFDFSFRFSWLQGNSVNFN